MEWQKGLSWEQQFELLGADGIDFHSIIATPPNCEIIDSFTKDAITPAPHTNIFIIKHYSPFL